jgi:hypothetical protein
LEMMWNEVGGRGLSYGIVRAFSWIDWGNSRNISVRMFGVLVEPRTFQKRI